VNLLALLGASSMLFVVWFTWRQYTGPQVGQGQSRRQSIIEAWVNILIGFSINYVANLALFPLMVGVQVSAEANWWGGWVYTTISILRQYAIRRWFNTQKFSAYLARRFG
jgi:hypothetical protein